MLISVKDLIQTMRTLDPVMEFKGMLCDGRLFPSKISLELVVSLLS